jgi:hypothetical protein
VLHFCITCSSCLLEAGAEYTVEISYIQFSSECSFFCMDGLGKHFDEGPPRTAKPGEIIAYYKIASEISSTSS